MRKKVALGLIMSLSLTSLCGCSAAENFVNQVEKDKEWAEENNAFTDGQNPYASSDKDSSAEDKSTKTDSVNKPDSDSKYSIGDIVSMTSENSDSMDISLTDWGTIWDEFKERNIIYITYSIENTGDTIFTVGNGFFNVYVDDYSVEQDYAQEDVIVSTDLSAGRKATGKIYLDIDSETVGSIEVECGDSVFVIKEPGNVEIADSAPEDNVYVHDEGITDMDIAGHYEGALGSDLSISIYSDPEGDAIGSIDMVDSYGTTYQCELIKIEDGYYQLDLSDEELYLSPYYEEDTIMLDFLSADREIEFFTMTEHYES